MPDRTPYLGAKATETKRTPYLGKQQAQTTRTPYLGATVTPPRRHSGGRGVLGSIGHAFKQGAVDFKNVAVHAPGGAIAVGKALEHDVVHGPGSPWADKNPRSQLVDIAAGTGKQIKSDLQHPLRHPGYTILDLLPVANAAGKVAEAGRVAKTGGTAGEVGKALVTRPVYESRTLRRGGLEVKVGSSQSSLGAAGQRVYDKALHAAAKPGMGRLNPRGAADRKLIGKIGKAVTAEAGVIQDTHKAAGAALVAMGRKLSPAEQKALQVIAEEAPLEGRITAASARVIGAKGRKARNRHQAELDLLHKAKPLLDETGGKPGFAAPHAARLGKVLDTMRSVATSREELLKSLGQLTDESIQGRKTHAARVSLGQLLEHAAGAPPEIPGQAALFDEPKAPLFEASPNAVRIPDVATRRGTRALNRQGGVGTAGSVGHQKALGSTTHEYTGALREHGVRRQDTTTLVGETAMESAKYAGLKHVHTLVRKAATPEPSSASDIAVRLDKLKSHERTPLEVRKFLDNPDEFFKTATPAEKASAFEGVRARLFVNPRKLDAEAAAEFNKLKADGKIGWVPKGILGDLAKPHLPKTGKAARGTDAINNASRFAILYLKPAYAIPNVLGNAALNVLQQGFAAVPNLARAARLNGSLGESLVARIDTLMGEGFARAISAHGQGVLSGAVDKAASIWSKGVDTPFRRSSFLYEAKRLGYDTPHKLEQLLTDEAHQEKLVEVTQRANREIIDYSNLTPTEREVIRRVVFFYPWVKGSTVYAGRMLREHPVKSAVIGQTGAVGVKNDPVAPSYLEGVVDVGGRLVNPTSAAILQTPAQVGQALAGLAGGDVGQVGDLSNFLSPASALAVAAITHRNRAGYQYPSGTNLGKIAFDQLVKMTPQYTLGQRISDAVNGKGQDRLYPPNVRDALLQYIVGGVAPRKYNKAKLAELAASERGRYVP